MRIKIRSVAPLLAAAGVCTAVALAPVAEAQPRCTTTAPYTTQSVSYTHLTLPTNREV